MKLGSSFKHIVSQPVRGLQAIRAWSRAGGVRTMHEWLGWLQLQRLIVDRSFYFGPKARWSEKPVATAANSPEV